MIISIVQSKCQLWTLDFHHKTQSSSMVPYMEILEMLSISSSSIYTVANEKGWLAMPTVGIYETKHVISDYKIVFTSYDYFLPSLVACTL